MKVVEQHLVPKVGMSGTCQDGIIVTESHAAVIDGATDKTRLRYEGLTGGEFAMKVCADVIVSLAPDVCAAAAVEAMTECLAARLPSDLAVQERPSAVVAIYSAGRREIWRVGDVSFWWDGMLLGGDRPRKLVDHHAAGLRAAVLAAELESGRTIDELRIEDSGRTAIAPLLTRQGLFVNNLAAGDWAYGALNGIAVPGVFIETYSVPEEAHAMVLASDGYPFILPTLKESEEYLQRQLEVDPLCMQELRGTKGVSPDAESFDDRAYLRLEV